MTWKERTIFTAALGLLLIGPPVRAHLGGGEQSPPPPAYACAFMDPVHFGASISAGYGDLLDGGAAFIRDVVFKENYYGPNYNPFEHMQRSWFGANETLNRAEMYPTANRFHADGSDQIKNVLATPAGQKRFARTTMMASMDAFYWPTVAKKCSQVLADVDEMIDLAHQEKKPLVVGNIPFERKDLVSPILLWHGWVAPPKKCAEQVNAKLAARCRAENQCYVIDLHGLVEKLNRGKIVYRGMRLRPHDVRGDGVHLTELGRSLVELQVAEAMAKNPPACASDEAAQRRMRQRYQTMLAASEGSPSSQGGNRGARALR